MELRILRLLLAAILPALHARPITPLRRSTTLRLLRHLSDESCADAVAIDIGGTLAKIVLFRPRRAGASAEDAELRQLLGEDARTQERSARELSVFVPELGADLHFFVFETRYIDEYITRTWRALKIATAPLVLQATGGGSYKYAAALRRLGIELVPGDEMGCLVVGLNFLLGHVPGEMFSVGSIPSPMATPAACAELARNYRAVTPPPDYMFVNIGSGVSILEVRGGRQPGTPAEVAPTRYRRMGGSSLGGSTFWGLVRLLTSCSTFDEVIRLTESGASSNVDMLVGDIYGGDCRSIGLSSDVIAASFGKVTMQREEKRRRGPMFLFRYLAALIRHYEEGFWLVILAIINTLPGLRHLAQFVGLVRFAESRAASVAMCGNFRAHDVALSLLRMVSNNVGHIACLSAQQCGLQHIVFGGSFIRDHPYTIATISSAVSFYSSGKVQALFLQHDGFVGAVGAKLAGQPIAGQFIKMPKDQPPGEGGGLGASQPLEAESDAASARQRTPQPQPQHQLHSRAPVQPRAAKELSAAAGAGDAALASASAGLSSGAFRSTHADDISSIVQQGAPSSRWQVVPAVSEVSGTLVRRSPSTGPESARAERRGLSP